MRRTTPSSCSACTLLGSAASRRARMSSAGDTSLRSRWPSACFIACGGTAAVSLIGALSTIRVAEALDPGRKNGQDGRKLAAVIPPIAYAARTEAARKLVRAGRNDSSPGRASGKVFQAAAPGNADERTNTPCFGIEIGDDLLVPQLAKIERNFAAVNLGEPHDAIIESRRALERKKLQIGIVEREAPAEAAQHDVARIAQAKHDFGGGKQL